MRKDIFNYLVRPVSASALVYFRMLFGGILLWQVYSHWRFISYFYIKPTFHFTYDFFHWVHPWPGHWMYIHFVVAAIAATCVAIGFLYRLASILLFLCFSYIFLLEQANYLNHMYFVCILTFLFIFVSANRCFSVDASLNRGLANNTVPFWNVLLLRFQIGVVYFFGGIAKLNSDWLSGEPLRHWLAKREHFEVIGPYLTQWWSPYFFSWGGLALDLCVPFLLLWRPTRLPAVAAILLFHLFNSYIFTIGIFPWLMLAATIIFFKPDCMEWALPRQWRSQQGGTGRLPFYLSAGQQCALALFVALQIFLPLRHWFFPGNVVWTEEGHKFSWRMKLRDKSSQLSFTILDPETNRKIVHNPLRTGYIHRRQFSKMKGRPDMFFQYVQLLKQKMKEKGIENPIIYARYLVSVNGRPLQWMVDPNKDLSEITYSPFTHSDWILPLPDGLPIGNYRAKTVPPEPPSLSE